MQDLGERGRVGGQRAGDACTVQGEDAKNCPPASREGRGCGRAGPGTEHPIILSPATGAEGEREDSFSQRTGAELMLARSPGHSQGCRVEVREGGA